MLKTKMFLLCALIINSTYATTEHLAITFTDSSYDITQIVQLQATLPMTKDPKIIANHPSATCFQADIKDYIPEKTKNVHPVYGCIFSDQVSMNAALLRAGLYIHTDLGMADDATLFSSKLMTTVGGHDFSGAQLVNYSANSILASGVKDAHKSFRAIEEDFNKHVLKPIITKNQDRFIFFAVINTKKFKENLTHELLHAQYYNVPMIAKILEDVWRRVNKTDQELIIECLKNGGYDMQQHDLLLREFYSYFLQYKATKYLESIDVLKPMAPLANIYAPQISQALAQHSIQVLTIPELD